MVQKAYLVVHGKEDLEKHPNILGLLVRVDENETPLHNEKGDFIPISYRTNEIKQGDRVVYYTTGDRMIKGIFEIASDRLDKNDKRRVEEWKRGQIQFVIRPIIKPEGGIALTTLIPKLNLFTNLKNPEKDYRMAIRGKNYIRLLDSHDFRVIEKTLQTEVKIEPPRNRVLPSKRQIMTRKYGSLGEGSEHKMLKNRVADNPELLGLTNVQNTDIEHAFISGDYADILFEIPGNHYVVVEIETDFPLPGCYQALKYRVLQCAEISKNINSASVEAVLVAKTMPLEVQNICGKYGIRTVLVES